MRSISSQTAVTQPRVQPKPAAYSQEPSIILDPKMGSPFIARDAIGSKSWPDHIFAACSVQKFAASTGAGDLSQTHADAQGWVNYLSQFEPANFYFKDASVSTWEYLDPTDDWLNTYGVDSCIEFYHSGHGGMDGNGVFYAPLGSAWGNKDAWATSNDMFVGNQYLRYLFWSTCFSVRVLDGQNPIRTWNNANQGLRMILGYETTSVDAGNYGSAMWNQWNQGKSLSTAFMDASWYNVSTHQAPAVVAMGATAQEAQDRVYNERFFSSQPASKAWYWWRWYYAARSAFAQRAANITLPGRITSARLTPSSASPSHARAVFDRLPLELSFPREVRANRDGAFHIAADDRRIGFDRHGAYDAQFASPNLENRDLPALRELIAAAHGATRSHGLDREGIVFDRVFHKYDNGGSTEGSGSIGTPRVSETVVQFVQHIDGIPVVSPGQGRVTVTLDNDLQVTGVHDSTRTVSRLVDQIPVRRARREGLTPEIASAQEPSELLASAWAQRLKTFIVNDSLPLGHAIVPGSFEVGYAIHEDTATLVAREEVEVDFGHGLSKRYVVEVPISA